MSKKEDAKRRRRGQIIELDSTTFRIRVPLGRHLNKSRGYHNETLYSTTKTKAEKRVTQVLSEIDSGIYFAPSKMTVEEFSNEWLEQKKRDGIRAVTLIGYKGYINSFINRLIGKMRLCDVKSLDIRDMYNSLHDEGYTKNSMQQGKAVLEMIFRQATAWKYIKENPCLNIKLPRAAFGEERSKTAFTPEQAKQIVNASLSDFRFLPFAFALLTGVRPAELSALKWSRIKLDSYCDPSNGELIERGIVEIREVTTIETNWQFTPPKTKKGVRDIYFSSVIYHRLLEWQSSIKELKANATNEWCDYDLVFPFKNGKPVHKEVRMNQFRKLLKELEVEDVKKYTLYSLRYTFATLSLLSGESDKVVSDRMGHTNINFTKDVYTQVLPQMAKDTSDKLERFLFEVGTSFAQNAHDLVN